ncbi:MAG: ADP-heptose synthase [Paenibacillaceae bacterium]|nr:ADP-heptose synthase [Paenibacillaceae bacterium]
MERRFVAEAVMLAIYGQLLVPAQPVEYVMPYSSLMELYDLLESPEPIMAIEEDDSHVRTFIKGLIGFFEEPLNKKKIERALASPWKKSPALLVNERVSVTVVYALENAEYGEKFDPIETDLILLSLREKLPVLTDQLEFVDKLIHATVPVQVFDIEDFEYALEADVPMEF